MAFHFWRKEAIWDTMLQVVEHNTIVDTACLLPRWTNVIMSISRVPQKEALCRNEGSESCEKGAMWMREQMNVSYMKDPAGTFPGERLNDRPCASTGPTAKTCLLADQRRKFTGCNLEADVLSTLKLDLLSKFASQVLNQNSDITRDENVKGAART